MSERDVDELFGGSGRKAEPKTGLALGTAALGLVLAIVGLACLSVPGGLLSLLAVWLIENEMDRCDNGFYAPTTHAKVERARRWVFAGLFLTIGVHVIQTYLYMIGFYEALGDLFFLTPSF